MKKITILFLMIACFMCCQDPVDLYTGRLVKVEFSSSFNSEQWMLTFVDGQIFSISKQPRMGFKLGAIYIIYENKDGYLRARKRGRPLNLRKEKTL